MNAEAAKAVMSSPLGREFVSGVLDALHWNAPLLHGEHVHDVIHNAALVGAANTLFTSLFALQPKLVLLMLEERATRSASQQ